MKKIHFHEEEIQFSLESESKTSNWISKIIASENKITGEINYIFCSDNYLHKINLEHLNHDTFTDIITFDYVENGIISGDIFVSIDRVKENAKEFKTLFNIELNRVLAHGVLHLLGYKDKSESEIKEMRSKEEFALSMIR